MEVKPSRPVITTLLYLLAQWIKNYFGQLLNHSTQYAYMEHRKNNHNNVPLWVLVNDSDCIGERP